eukprot:4311704-Pleurochrysis_carterae.AAC.1
MGLPEPIERAISDGEPWKEWPEIFVPSISAGERERGGRERSSFTHGQGCLSCSTYPSGFSAERILFDLPRG